MYAYNQNIPFSRDPDLFLSTAADDLPPTPTSVITTLLHLPIHVHTM